jgi:hypothetical protein
MAEESSMPHELDVLEARRIADALLGEVPDAGLSKSEPARGEHNTAGSLVLIGVLAGKSAGGHRRADAWANAEKAPRRDEASE